MREWELENPQNSNGFASSFGFFCIWLAVHCCECIWLNNQKQTLWGWPGVPTSSSGPCAHTTETDWHLLQHSRINNQNKNPAWFFPWGSEEFSKCCDFFVQFCWAVGVKHDMSPSWSCSGEEHASECREMGYTFILMTLHPSADQQLVEMRETWVLTWVYTKFLF